MTDPQIREPANVLHDARDALHAAGAQLLAELGQLLPDKGFHAEHMDRWPNDQTKVPGGWVDLPTITRVIEASGTPAVVATFPVLFPVNGDDQAQVQLQDHLLSRGWDLFAAVQLDNADGGRRSGATVQTAGPADIDVGGAVLRGVVFSVQVRLLVRTLCPQRITSTDTTP
jgi:hypothetical protein